MAQTLNDNFFPFTLTKPVNEIRVGILTLKQKAAFVNYKIDGTIVLLSVNDKSVFQILNNSTDIVKQNNWAIQQDYIFLTSNKISATISSTNKITNPTNIFLEDGVKMEHCYIDASAGPVYIAKNANIMQGAMLYGPVSIGENAMLKMGTKIYGATTIGPNCIVGGEIKNCVFFGNSNKAHDGYLGDSVIGEWCNFGAGTSNSNVKNTGGDVIVKLGNLQINAGNKCGMLMGDYSRAAINTSFNTGSVIGVCCNIFANGLTPKYIENFSWGCTGEKYKLEKAFADIDNWKKMKGQTLTLNEKEILTKIYNKS